MSTERPLYVVGHKNPDTDSVCSAIVYAAFQDRVLGNRARAFRAGNVNPQTAYVLKRVGVSAPPLLTDVYPKIEDIMIRGNQLITLSPQTPVARARELMLKHRFTFLPVCGDGGKCLGKITTLELLRLPDVLGRLDGNTVTLSLAALGEQLDLPLPEQTAGDSAPSFSGSVLIEPDRSTPRTPPPYTVPPVLRVFRSPSRFEQWQSEPTEPTPTNDDLTIVCSGDGTSRTTERGTVFSTEKPLTEALAALTLALPVESFIEDTDIRFAPDDRVKDVQVEIAKSNLGGFLVTDRRQRLTGVITRMSFLSESRFRVVLVDHNEFSQAVPGIEQAEIVEILDHHRIGIRSTDQPITFINRVVGCTATIVAGLFRSHGATPTEQEAALLLAAILSDTVILRSPTTTQEDRDLAHWLAGLAGVELEAFGREMFQAGSVLATQDATELVKQDQKHYSEGEVSFLVSQVETVGFSSFWQRQETIAAALHAEVREQGCTFGCLMVSDITAGDTLLVTAGSEEITGLISYPEAAPGVFELRGVLSRKKQVLPYLVELLRQKG
jgi:manganese-dependent inorganic pyrophosphatase